MHKMIGKPTFFKDNRLQKEFEENGFVKVPLLSGAEADELLSFFDSRSKFHEVDSSLHHTTTDTRDTQLILEVDEKIKSTLTPELDKYLLGYKPLASCFHIKEVGQGSATHMHQDPTFVDESKYYSANVWVALHDVHSTNGNLFFVKATNRVYSLRPIPVYPPYYRDFSDRLAKNLTEVPLKKGEAVIFHNSTVHGATDNISTKRRVAATLLVSSDEAKWCIYYNDPEGKEDKLEKYSLDMNAFMALTKSGRPPQEVFSEEVNYHFPILSEEEFAQTVHTTHSGFSPKRWIGSLFKERQL
jgi:hypothetical protein